MSTTEFDKNIYYTSEILGSVMRLKLRRSMYASFAYFIWFYSQSQFLVIKHAQFLQTASQSVWWDQCRMQRESTSIVCSYQRCSAFRNLNSPSRVNRIRNKPYPELQHHFMNVENNANKQPIQKGSPRCSTAIEVFMYVLNLTFMRQNLLSRDHWPVNALSGFVHSAWFCCEEVLHTAAV